MSFLSKVFGGKKEDKVPTVSMAIQKLRETEEMLVKKQEFLERKIEVEIQTVKKNGTANRRVSLQALKRKKRYEKQLQQIDGTLATIEMQREALESANTNTEVLNAMGVAAKTMQNVHQNLDVDKVHEMMDDISEQQEVANEISEAISSPLAGFGNDIDQDELERELEEMEQEELDKELLETKPTANDLPSIPETSLPAAEDEDDLKQLEQWAT